MKELLDTLNAWQAEGHQAARAVVVRTFGSAPRPEGAVLLVSDDDRLAGSVSGGCVEGAAFEEIQRARRDGNARVIRYGISDEEAWDVGLACGGTIDVLVEPLVRDATAAAAKELGRVVAIPLPADAPPPEFGRSEPGAGELPPPPVIVGPSGIVEGSLGSAADDAALGVAARDALLRGTSRTVEIEGRSVFVEAFPVKPRLVVVGAVEVARSLVRLARELGYETIVIDGRASFATPERF